MSVRLVHGTAPKLTLKQAAQLVTHIRHEINLHISECKEFGLTQQYMDQCEESQGMTRAPRRMDTKTDQSSSVYGVLTLRARHWTIGGLVGAASQLAAVSARL